MTATEILRTLRRNRRNVLWINDDRQEAALSEHDAPCCTPVDYDRATWAKTDPSVTVVEIADGIIYAATN